MTYQLVIKPGAERDIKETTNWYENKQEHLGLKYVEDLDQKLSKVQSNPLLYQVRYKSIRLALLDVFPETIHFSVEENTVYIHAVLGTARDPQLWNKI